jgi:hypothetical protein
LILDKAVVRIRRGRKKMINEDKNEVKQQTRQCDSVNRVDEDEIYEKIDADKNLDLIETREEKRDFFERANCRFNKPDPLATETYFRTHKEARILTRGDRDIIMKRTTEEVIIVYYVCLRVYSIRCTIIVTAYCSL